MQATRGAPLTPTAGPTAPRRTTWLLLVAGLVLAADIISKAIVVASMEPGRVVRLAGHYLELTNTRNSGAAFSVGTGATVLFTAVAVVVVAVILRTAKRLRSLGWAICLGLLLGGALGNVTDRLRLGRVTDFVDAGIGDLRWPAFNVADSAFVVGIFMLTVLIFPLLILGFSAISAVFNFGRSSILNPGPHGLSEILYAFTSQAGNNGSAFAGLTTNTPWYNTAGAMTMLFGRFFMIIPTLAIAGNLAQKKYVPPSLGTFPVTTPLFTLLLIGVILIVGALTFFPALSLGPILEHLLMMAGKTF